MEHATHVPPVNAGSSAPPPARTTAAGFPARMASRTVNTEPRDGPQRKATTPDDARAKRPERARSAARPAPAPGTTRPPSAAKVPSAEPDPAATGPGRNTTDPAQAGAPAGTTASSAYWSPPLA